MSNKAKELKPTMTMTKAKALKIVLDYVKEHGYPERDVILDGDIEMDNGVLKMINEWSFMGLCKFLIDEQ